MAKKKTNAEIRASLMEQLKELGKTSAHFESLIDHYMDLQVTIRKLNSDIKKRGTTYLENMSTGGKKWVTNPAIKELNVTHKTALSILHELGVTAEGTDFKDEKM